MSGSDFDARGLSATEAAARLVREGPNELPREPPRSLWTLSLTVMEEPMFRLLVAAGVIYLLLGDLGEASMLLFFILLSASITVVQQSRTDRAIEALRDLSSPRARVVRDGEIRRIAGRELVRGDLIVLGEGDRIPADAVLVTARAMQVDESLLTGESVAVDKEIAHPERGRVYAGTLVVGGRGLATVNATGPRCEMGRIGTLLATIVPEPTPLAREIRRLVRIVATLGLGVSGLVVIFHGLTYGDWLQAVLAGIALAMALLPEEFPVVQTVFLALGARRLASAQVLTRRAETIEALGSATILCADKTGTLTENRMAVGEIWGPVIGRWRATDPLTPEVHGLLRIAVEASASHPVEPMERALHALQAPDPGRVALCTYELRSDLLVMGHAFANGPGIRLSCKGAPEAIAQLCRLTPSEQSALQARVAELAARGLRVLAVATADCDGPLAPLALTDVPHRFLGLLAFADPLRASAGPAIAECREAGIRVLMITGDHPVTALAIARAAGLTEGDGILSGAEIDSLDDRGLADALARTSVCARVSPHHKLRIVQALKPAGNVIGMTGDGVNDAPALRAAHIGIAMGERGTDVAREAASIVLLDDDFGSIVTAVRAGRQIRDNLTKALAYVVAVHLPIAGLSLLPLLAGWPLLLGPLHIVFMELVVDPVCSIVFEAEPAEEALMKRPPRGPHTPLFPRPLLLWSVLQGLLALTLLMLLDWVLRQYAMPESELRGAMFLALIGSNLAMLFINRRFSARFAELYKHPNPVLWPVLGAVGLLLATILGVPGLRGLFGIALPGTESMLGIALVPGALFLLLEILKRRLGPSSPSTANQPVA